MAGKPEFGDDGLSQCGLARDLIGSLTQAEMQLVQFATAGHSLLQIAGRLGIPLEDAAMLKVTTMKKLGVAHTAELVRLALDARIEDCPIRAVTDGDARALPQSPRAHLTKGQPFDPRVLSDKPESRG